jgi:hypothetical protein
MKYYLLLTVLTFIYTKLLRKRTRGDNYYVVNVKYYSYAIDVSSPSQTIYQDTMHTQSLLIIKPSETKNLLLNFYLITKQTDPHINILSSEKTFDISHLVEGSDYVGHEFTNMICNLEYACVKWHDLYKGNVKLYEIFREGAALDSETIFQSNENKFTTLTDGLFNTHENFRNIMITELINQLKVFAEISKPIKLVKPIQPNAKDRKGSDMTRLITEDKGREALEITIRDKNNNKSLKFFDKLLRLVGLLFTSNVEKFVDSGVFMFRLMKGRCIDTSKIPQNYQQKFDENKNQYVKQINKIINDLDEEIEQKIKKRNLYLKRKFVGSTFTVDKIPPEFDVLIENIIDDFQIDLNEYHNLFNSLKKFS